MRVEATAGGSVPLSPPHLDRLSRDLYPSVRRWAARWADTADEAEDIAQEAMIKLVTGFGSFRGRGHVESWMYRITRNVAVSLQRRRAARRRAEGRFHEAADRVTPGDLPARVEARRLAQLALARADELSPRKRIAFLSVSVEGQTAAETGRRLGVEPATIRSLVCRARLQIRRALPGWTA